MFINFRPNPRTFTQRRLTAITVPASNSTFLGVNLPLGDKQLVYNSSTQTVEGRTVNKPNVSCYSGTVRTLSDTGNATTNATNLARQITSASAGDIIELPAGAIFQGPILMPEGKTGYILIRTGAGEYYTGSVRRTTTGSIAKIRSAGNANGGGAVQFLSSSAYFHFQDVAFVATTASNAYYQAGLIECSHYSASVNYYTLPSHLPNRIGFERCFFDGGDYQVSGTYMRRGFGGHANNWFIDDCYFRKFADPNSDSQAICTFTGGPAHIENTYLDGTCENVMFGGAAPVGGLPNVHDVVIKRCHFYTDPAVDALRTYYGAKKNLMEIKNCVRIAIADCEFEYSWARGQTGWAIGFKSNETDTGQGTDNWCLDALVINARIKHVGQLFGMASQNTAQSASLRTGRVTFHNILATGMMYSVAGFGQSGDGRSGITKVPAIKTIAMDFVRYNKMTELMETESLGSTTSPGPVYMLGGLADGGEQMPAFYWTNNITHFGNYGFFANNIGGQNPGLSSSFATYSMAGNVAWGSNASWTGYPSGNRAVATLAAVLPGWTGSVYTIPSGNVAKTLGVDPLTYIANNSEPGADQALIESLTAGCVTGVWT